MAIDIQINGYDLQSTSIITREIQHDSGTPQDLESLIISRQEGAKLISATYRPKNISVAGVIKGTSLAELEDNIDTFKKNVSVSAGELDFEYAGGFRRYVVGTSGITINRNYFHLNFAPFSIQFEVLDPPFGLQIGSIGGETSVNTALSSDGATAQVLEDTLTFGGTAPPKPNLRYVIDDHHGLDQIVTMNKSTNQQMVISTAFTAGDQISVDTNDLVVEKNGVEIGYSGFFPEFTVGSNEVVTKLLASDADSVDLQNVNTDSHVQVSSDAVYVAMRFQPATSTDFPLLELLMQAGSSNRVDDVTWDIRIETHDATSNGPSGSAVTNGTTTVAGADIPKGTFGWVQAVFATAPALTAGTDYWVVAKAQSGVWITEPTNWVRFSTFLNDSSYKFGYRFGDTPYSITDDKGITFKLYKDYTSAAWVVDRRVDYQKRFL